MRKLIIASHSTLAEGFKETLEFLTGRKNDYISLCAYVNGNEEIEELVRSLLDTEDEVIVLTDIAGGSVNQKFFAYVSDRVHVIAGINLPLAISIALQLDDPNLNITKIIEESQKEIIYMNKKINEIRSEDE